MLQRFQSLRDELGYARTQTDELFGLISPEALYARPIADRHRLIFYLGHVDAFDWNVLARRSRGEPAFHDAFDQLFARGIDPEPGAARSDSPGDWPTAREVNSYNCRTRAWIDSHFEELEPELIRMAIEHRHMHAETLAYLLHALEYDQKLPSVTGRSAALAPRPAPENPLVEVAAGCARLGQPEGEFAWDNERQAHEVPVAGFRMSKFKISNGEYLEFVRDGGPPPHFWVRGAKDPQAADGWYFRGMFEIAPLPLDSPAWLTWQQASAYASWRGLSLPTEVQFQRAASLDSPEAARDNFGYHRWNPVAVDAGQAEIDQARPVQMTGNGWEWTSDVFAPFAGFEPHPFYPGYSADFFDGKHYVLKGASPRTASVLARPSFRNWFRPDYPYLYAGFRLVEN